MCSNPSLRSFPNVAIEMAPVFICASLLQVIDGVVSLALYPQVVSQAPQHIRASEKQATGEGCFAC